MLLIGFIAATGSNPQSFAVPGRPPQSPAVPCRPLRSPMLKMSCLAGPAVRHKDGRPEVSKTGVDRTPPSRPVQGSWQSPRRALRGPRTVENTASSYGTA